jgi:cell division protease FtsH
MDRISKILLERETIDSEEFVQLLEGKSEDEVFGSEPEERAKPEPEPEPDKGTGRKGPRPVPRPGLAGGGAAEMRGDER